jgi:hypothetical protein
VRHEAHAASPLSPHAAYARRHFCSLARLTTSNEASRPLKRLDGEFPVAANVIAPVTDLRALFSLHRSGSSGPIGHSI